MKESPYKPALDKVISFISDKIKSGDLKPGDLIYSSRKLATACNVSRDTVTRAIALLKVQGVLVGTAQRRPHIKTADIPTTSTPLDDPYDATLLDVFGSTKKKMTQHILNGEFEQGKPLPSLKNLCYKYEVSAQTIRKVLAHLAHTGLLSVCKRKYIQIPKIETKPSLTIALIGFTFDESGREVIIRGQHDYALCNYLSTQCASRNIQLKIIKSPLVSCTNLRNGYDGSPFINTDDVIGFIVLYNYPNANISSLLSLLTKTRKQVIVVDGMGDDIIQQALSVYPEIYSFRYTLGYLGARLITQHLLNMGHQKFGFVSPYQSIVWSKLRHAGIIDELASVGLHNNLTALTFEINDTIEDIFATTNLKDSDSFETFFRKQRELGTLFPTLMQEVLEDRFFMLDWWGRLKSRMNKKVLEQSLSSLVTRRDITALILINDEIAEPLLWWLRKNNIRIPHDMSIASFDNSSDALHQGITSVHFDLAGIVSQMLTLLLMNSKTRAAHFKKAIEIPSIVIHRETTAPPPGAGKD